MMIRRKDIYREIDHKDIYEIKAVKLWSFSVVAHYPYDVSIVILINV